MTHPVFMDRPRAAQLGQETVEILNAGCYVAPSGSTIPIAESVQHAAHATESFPPEKAVLTTRHGNFQTVFAIHNETTLEAAKRLVDEGHNVAALNFASATNPGGGFLTGARAQEESICRSSGLYACLKGNPMYAYHRKRRDVLYSHYVLWSPDVPIFRTDDGTLLEEPWTCSILTSPAVMAKEFLSRHPERRRELRPIMWERTLRVLGVAAEKGHDTLVLGAWGCGAFGYDPEEMAALFRKALTDNFAGAYARIEFAIVDRWDDAKIIGPFEAAFADL
jgi:uncharacterized protein (TIGR02452 family)